MRRIGIVAALAEEGDALFPGAGEQRRTGPFPSRHLVRGRIEISILQSGIGKVNAAMAATLLASRESSELLLSIGTAGLIAAHEERCFWIASAVQHDYGAEHSEGFTHYTAGDWPIGPAQLQPFVAMPDPGLGLQHARVASGDAFIECPDRSRLLAEGLGADLVEMETAAIAQVAAQFGLPWAGIRAASDGADGKSAGDFESNLLAAARLAAGAGERFVALLDKSLND